MSDVDPGTAMALASNPVVQSMLSQAASFFGKGAVAGTKAVVDRAVATLHLGFEEYLLTSYNKCRLFKTILDTQTPLSLSEHYVHVTVSCSNTTMSDGELVSRIDEFRRVVITGLAGSGKSMFMKYLTVSHFEHPNGKIPIFIELRKLNGLESVDLLNFIRTTSTGRGHYVSEDQFDLVLRAGGLVLVLDGFDEINHDARMQVQEQILALEKDYPRATVIISSRPDDRFGGWSSYFVFQVEPLSKSQCLTLLNGLTYDPGVKRRFIREVKARLFESHESFLSYPLLASIMLLTYEQFAEIPQKMHEFYSHAFDTLFQKHDAQKEQYQRLIKTGLGRDDFKKCAATFCALSYLNSQFEFSEETLIETAKSTVNYVKNTGPAGVTKFTEKELIDDLFEAVCMLQKDGLSTVFVHRSFQEYFAALFVTKLHGDRVKKFLDKCAERISDNVLSMALDMNRESIENEWVIPTVEMLESTIFSSRKNTAEVIIDIYGAPYVNSGLTHSGKESSRIVFISMPKIPFEIVGPLENLSMLYRAQMKGSVIGDTLGDLGADRVRTKVLLPSNVGRHGYDVLESILAPTNKTLSPQEGVPLTPADDWWLDLLGVNVSLDRARKGLAAIKRDIRSQDRKRKTILEEFL